VAIKNNFYLLGYESGVLVALEIAAILEENGELRPMDTSSQLLWSYNLQVLL
jgi:hypothetical protein